MSDAAQLFGLGFSLLGLGVVLQVLTSAWLKWRESTARQQAEVTAGNSDVIAALDARLRSIEHTVEATAVEVERIAEAQRFSARLLSGEPERASTPERR